ncbi:MAG TPA: DUF4286 family protein [Bacteroidia bacterium]|jgi:hypothetical protein
MIIYNVTVNVENDIREEWLKWMKEIHIPDVMATGYFTENRICKVLVDEEQGTTYSVQYMAASMEKLKEYQRLESPRLQKEHNDKYASKCVAFRTLLEVV